METSGAKGELCSARTPSTRRSAPFAALRIWATGFPVTRRLHRSAEVGQFLLGDRIALHLPAFTVNSAWELVLYTILGGVCGVVGVLFKRGLFAAGTLMNRLALPNGLRGGFAGLVVGLIAAGGLPAVMGNGYAFMEELAGHAEAYGIGFLAMLLIGKLVATAATAAGRSGAGLFAPSLFVGVVTGTLCGQAFQAMFPSIVTAPGAYGMVGMAAVAGATLHAPITMTLMLFEMTRNYAVILPLLAAVATASVVSRYFRRESIYEAELRHQGIELDRGREELVMHDITVGDIMREEGYETVPVGAVTGDIVARFLSRRTDVVFVVGAGGVLEGIIDIQDAKRFFAEPDDTGHALHPRKITTLRAEQRLSEAIGAFFAATVEEMPVVSADGRLVGVRAERDVVAAYHREVLRQAVPLTRVVQEGPEGRRTDFLELPPGEVLEVVPVRPWMVGRTLRDLGLPRRFECAVLAVRVPSPDGSPPTRRPALPETLLADREELVVIGPVAGVQALAESEGDVASAAGDEAPHAGGGGAP